MRFATFGWREGDVVNAKLIGLQTGLGVAALLLCGCGNPEPEAPAKPIAAPAEEPVAEQEPAPPAESAGPVDPAEPVEPAEPVAQEDPVTQPEPAAQPPQPEDDQMTEPALVTVNGQPLTRTMASSIIQEIASQQGVPPQMMQDFLQRGGPQLQQQAISQFIDQTLAAEEAKRRNYSVSEEEVSAVLLRLTSSLPPGVTIEQAVASRGMTMEQLRGEVAENEVNRKLFEEVTAEVTPATDEEISAFYTGNPQFFQKDASVSASHILIGCDEKADEAAHTTASAEAEAVRKQLEEGGDFAELALAKSTCPSKNKGGDLGTFGRGQKVPVFEEAAFTQDVGAIGPVVKSNFGYHIIKVTDRTEPTTQPLDEAKEQISEYLTNQGRNTIFGEFLKELRAKATIEYADGVQQG